MSLRIVLVALVLAPAVGCTWMRENFAGHTPNKNNGPIKPVNANDLVAYVNNQADRLQSISYKEVTVATRDGPLLKPLTTLHGHLAASQPRNFRMSAEGNLAGKVDMGSNDNLFWVAFRVPTQQPQFVFASHTDFASGKAQLPGNVPFEPEWVMQALGMTRLPPGNAYRVDVDDKARTYKLSWPAKTPNGQDVKKEIVFAVDDADAGRNQPQIKKHVIYDMKNRPICWAEVKAAKSFQTGVTDPQTGRPFVAQYPTEVVLRWEEQKFEMTLNLRDATVNRTLTPDDVHRLFDLPPAEKAGANPINLAEARFELPRR